MIRRNLARKLFVGYSFLLMLPAAALNPRMPASLPVRPTGTPSQPLHDSTKRLSPDTASATGAAPGIGLNKNVTGFVNAYLKKEDEFLQKMKVRSQRYFGTIEDILSTYSLPLELKYLAIVESKLQPKATSRAGARGMWQLMPVTAKELGLRVSGKTDERLHTYRSTVAAAKYLRRLYAEFGDWLLVLAAYNGGPGTVYKAIKKAGSKNYWALQRFLPAESRGHVKRFIGVHYFFEGEGSVTTQTKAEAKAWQKKLAEEKELLLAKTAGQDTIATQLPDSLGWAHGQK
ncbi:MAG TPA: lytic transglycosylase domain-containing protein [Flavisolibacter sp.]|nr:lytic transglycosylase domain-containing protein [Flavisolibacter sp.]